MPSAIAHNLDALAAWRNAVDRQLARVGRVLVDVEVGDDALQAQIKALRERLASDKLVLAFVAEFSRGKSELINAIFFADAGRRVLPATPGRTTMCPVELRCDLGVPSRLSLLPMETRLQGLSLAELRGQEQAWQHHALEPRNAAALAQALSAVTRTQRVSLEQAKALGFWSDEQPEDNPPQAADGTVEVPAWRHALINYPHPLLERGLVVIDTPGLNAIGAEPELTLGLLPTAHAVVFVLAADTGVTRSDLAVWKEHLDGSAVQRYVVLNKIDTLSDPLLTAEEIAAQINSQRRETASTLGVPERAVFAVSAREALTRRTGGAQDDAAADDNCQISQLEHALSAELLPRQQELLVQSGIGTVQRVVQVATRQLTDRRRLVSDQLGELHSLRGKSGAKLKLMLERVDLEAADFERCIGRLATLRTVHMRMMRQVNTQLGSDALRNEITVMKLATSNAPFGLAGRGPLQALMARLQATLRSARSQCVEMQQMLEASFLQLNTDFGFSFSVSAAPAMEHHLEELDLIASNYGRYFTVTQIWRMAAPGFADQFRRMLTSKLRVVFENAGNDLDLWSRAAVSQMEQQIRERRRGYARRRDALKRVQSAAGDLESCITEVQTQDALLEQQLQRLAQVELDALATVQRKRQDAPMPADPQAVRATHTAAPSPRTLGVSPLDVGAG